ncbi:MAG: LytTR family transcriptional regulator DNA-binding domain-containing protein [Bacteroidales bacterium]|nr:LytTR family transcriptional regulator DNA-binding domain-containing protein [Bacteroidales bacterium]
MNKKYLLLNSRDELYRIDISRIVYFEADGNYTRIVLSNNTKGVVGMNLAQMQRVLNDSLKESAVIFARVGKKHIININYIYCIAVLRQQLILSDGGNFSFQLDVSKEALKKLKELYVPSAQNPKE